MESQQTKQYEKLPTQGLFLQPYLYRAMPSKWVQRWGYISDDAPPGRCGVTVTFPHTGSTKPISDVTCWRETWDDFGQCIWHADTDSKPIEKLVEARTDYPERLDGSIIRESNLGSSISFENCELNGSEFTRTNMSLTDFTNCALRWANFNGSILFNSEFMNADLKEADLSESDCHEADFSSAEVVQADFTNAILTRTIFSSAILIGSTFTDADLRGATLNDAELWKANFTNSDLRFATIISSDMGETDLSGASARNAQFQEARLENAILTRTDVREANLSGADLFQAQFSDIRIDSQTEFGEKCSYELEDKSPNLAQETDPLKASTWVYRRLESIHEENAMADLTRHYHIRKEEAQRKLNYKERNYGRYAVSTLNRYLTKHGESIQQLLIFWAVTIVGSGLLYPFIGGVEDNGAVFKIQVVLKWPTVQGLVDAADAILRGLYFSVITFTTIGYANVAPHGAGSRVLVGFESLIGAILIALFVYVLGRRVAR